VKVGQFWRETKTGRVGMIVEIDPPRPVASNIVHVVFGNEIIKIMNGQSFIRNYEIATVEEAKSFPKDISPNIPRRIPER
jgi:hypothetical protein